MEKYYVNQQSQSNGDHEVHKDTCVFFPAIENKILLGEFHNCWEAVAAAKKHYVQVNGCYACSRECHTQ